jgi:hypothetical protein
MHRGHTRPSVMDTLSATATSSGCNPTVLTPAHRMPAVLLLASPGRIRADAFPRPFDVRPRTLRYHSRAAMEGDACGAIISHITHVLN